MSQTVFLHVGLPKSGTTYIQRVLATHKEALASNEHLLFPGRAGGSRSTRPATSGICRAAASRPRARGSGW